MSRVPKAIWDNLYGLLVDDGQLALGTLAALAVTWLVAAVAPEYLRPDTGWLLLLLILVLVFANLYAAGRNARRRAS